MPKITNIEKVTDNRFVNLYNLDVENRLGKPGKYYVASRAKDAEDLEINRKESRPDGVIIYALYGENKDKVVLIRQYRFAIDQYIYEFPAGLVEKDEDYREAAVREMREETGLTLKPADVDPSFEKPFYTTVGMTDECCGTVYGYASGEIKLDMLEDSEDLQVVLADRKEAQRILREEKVAIMCAYQLMHFISDEEPFGFMKKEEK